MYDGPPRPSVSKHGLSSAPSRGSPWRTLQRLFRCWRHRPHEWLIRPTHRSGRSSPHDAR